MAINKAWAGVLMGSPYLLGMQGLGGSAPARGMLGVHSPWQPKGYGRYMSDHQQIDQKQKHVRVMG
jgi:hypothetical protein